MVVGLGLKPLVQPCVREDKLLPTGECYEMLPAHRWRGVWEDHLEGQVFCPGAATQCPAGGSGIWLDYASAKRPAGWTPGGVYAIDFIGRRTKFEGGYGHMGASRHAMVVDRMISMKQLQAPQEK